MIICKDVNAAPSRRALLGVAAMLVAPPARAQAWPGRPVRIVSPFAPGGSSDGPARFLAERLMPMLGQPVIVENRAGAGSLVGTTYVAQSTDQHTLLLGSMSHVVNPLIHARLGYDPIRDFAPVTLIGATPVLVVVPAASPLRSLAELIRAGQRDGELTYASAGNATVNHLAAELFKRRTGTRILNVTYRGEAALMPDLLSGTVSTGFLNLAVPLPLIREGRLRALAVASPARLAALPEVPTLAEAGVTGADISGWRCILAAANVPPEGRDRLEAALTGILAQGSSREALAELGLLPVPAGSRHMAEFLRQEAARWREVIQAAGIRGD